MVFSYDSLKKSATKNAIAIIVVIGVFMGSSWFFGGEAF